MRVRDTGIGIAPEMLPRIFDLFVQGRQALDRSQGGLGIGLTIVQQPRRAARRHGGAHSDGLGKGASSSSGCRWPHPRCRCAERRAAHGAASRPTASRVLVVDDNVDAARTAGQALGVLGCTVAGGPRRRRAPWRRWRCSRRELVLLDIGLPGMDGYELAAPAAPASAHPALRIVAVTGYGQPSDRAALARGGLR